MACSGIRYGPCTFTAALLDDRSRRIFGFGNLRSQSIPNIAVKNTFSRISATSAFVSDRHVSNQASSFADLAMPDRFVNDDIEFYDQTIEISSASDKLDELIQDSVTEIVKNIRQAPLLLQIYANGEVKTEKAVKAKNWPKVSTERSSSPDGIILVEELREKRDDESDLEFKEEDRSRAFGVLIQGNPRGRSDRKSACYLLKTSSVNGGGIGIFCSHYCLMKVKNFTESAASQLNDCWLVK